LQALVDNDILLKLCAFDLLDPALDRLSLAPENVIVRDATYHSIRRSRQIAGRWGAATVNRAMVFLERVTRIQDPADQSELDLLTAVERIDPGEAELFVYAGEYAGAVLLTGDKNSLQALAAHEPARAIFARLAGRVIILETIVLALIRSMGFPAVRTSVCANLQADNAMRSAFGSGPRAQEVNVIHTLNGYVQDLESVVGKGWLRAL